MDIRYYQPTYTKDGHIVSVSTAIFETREQAEAFGAFVCKRGQKVEVIPVDLMPTAQSDEQE